LSDEKPLFASKTNVRIIKCISTRHHIQYLT